LKPKEENKLADQEPTIGEPEKDNGQTNEPNTAD